MIRPLAAAALAALLAAPAGAAAATPDPLPATVASARGRIAVSLDLSAAFAPALERRLGNGLTNVVTVFVALVPEADGEPVAVTGRFVEVLYDVWDEAYAVTIRDARLSRPVRRTAGDFAALRRLLADGRDLDLGPAALLPAGPFHVEARVEINPVSRELMQRTRELLANPAAGTRPGAGTRSVLGAMAGYLLREPDAGDDVHLLRSRVLARGDVVTR
ncbi:MAG TPA: hypothetical protein VFP50_06980 [Anaeromyxobacteraceae bacterium]|nr:hypothetical protein [Anaeromyxobacteraceae bacterium]